MVEDAPNLRRDLSLKLHIVARQMRTRFDQSVAELGVTRSQWSVLIVAAHRPGANQRDIARALDMAEAPAGRLIDKLCSEGLLIRKPRTDDKRAYSVWLTDKAQPIVDQLAGIASENEAMAFAGVSDDQLVQLAALLGMMAENVGGTKDRPPED
jgi:MarR family transcriptional regulator for hemolysin